MQEGKDALLLPNKEGGVEEFSLERSPPNGLNPTVKLQWHKTGASRDVKLITGSVILKKPPLGLTAESRVQ